MSFLVFLYIYFFSDRKLLYTKRVYFMEMYILQEFEQLLLAFRNLDFLPEGFAMSF